MVERHVDILIVGGGLTGAALSLALRGSGYSTCLVESKRYSDATNTDFDARSLALAPASVRVLNMLSVWPLLSAEASPIQHIHISEQARFGRALLRQEGSSPLGYVVEMQPIQRAIYQVIAPETLLAPAQLIALDVASGLAEISSDSGRVTIHAKLIVAADGAQSHIRTLLNMSCVTKDYQQTALIANVGLARQHGNYAYERFTAQGPLALLPMTRQRMALIWSMPSPEAARLLDADEALFLKELQAAFGYRVGRFIKVGERAVYPLKQVIMPRQTAWPVAFVGNAAHTLHPVAGQGFNLGLRDVAMLAQCIIQYGLLPQMLTRYEALRTADQVAVTQFTNGLVELFAQHTPGFGLLRGLGLFTLDNLPIAKQILAYFAKGFVGPSPDLVCQIPLLERHHE